MLNKNLNKRRVIESHCLQGKILKLRVTKTLKTVNFSQLAPKIFTSPCPLPISLKHPTPYFLKDSQKLPTSPSLCKRMGVRGYQLCETEGKTFNLKINSNHKRYWDSARFRSLPSINSFNSYVPCICFTGKAFHEFLVLPFLGLHSFL